MFQSFNISPMSVALINDSLRGMARSRGTKLPDVAVVLHTVELFSGNISNVREDPLNNQHSRGVGGVSVVRTLLIDRLHRLTKDGCYRRRRRDVIKTRESETKTKTKTKTSKSGLDRSRDQDQVSRPTSLDFHQSYSVKNCKLNSQFKAARTLTRIRIRIRMQYIRVSSYERQNTRIQWMKLH